MSRENKIKKFISLILITAIIAPAIMLSRPSPTEAQFVPVNDSAGNSLLTKLTATIGSTATTATKETLSWGQKVLEQVLKVAAKALLAEITKSTINWINSGFHGQPLFLENPESFFKNIAKSQVKNLVDMIGYDDYRFPYGKQTALNIINSYKSQFEINAQYSLSKVINDPQLLIKYRSNFNYGGWNGFLINTQYPQNNYLGFQMMVNQNLASRLEGTIQAPAQKVQSLLQQGMGFLSPQTCPTNPNYNLNYNEFQRVEFKSTTPVPPPPTRTANDTDESYARKVAEVENAYRNAVAAEKAVFNGPTGPNVCPGGLKSTTPGTVVANKIMTSLNIPLESKLLDGALGNSVAAIIDALLNKVVGDFFNKGLTGIKGSGNAGYTADNWTYNGISLSGEYSGGAGYDLSVIPQNVSVGVGEETSTTVPAGTTIQNGPNVAKARARISGNTLIVTGVAPGETSFTVKKSSSSQATTVQVSVHGIGDLIVIPARIRMGVGDTMTATISGGTSPYFVIQEPNRKFVTTSFSDTSLVFSALEKGNTSIQIKDSSEQVKTISVPIEVVETADPEDPEEPGGGTSAGGGNQAAPVCSSIIPQGGESYGTPIYTGFLYGVSPSVTSVRVAVWSDENGQDDIFWYDGKKYTPVPNAWSYEIDTTKHPVGTNTKIIAHGYMYSPTSPANGTFCGDAYFSKTD